MAIADLPDRIKNHIMEETKRTDKEYADNRIGVTELLGCLRKSYFRRKNPRPISVEQAFVFYRGQVFDEIYTSLFPRNQIRVSHRISESPIVITGRIDFIDDDNAIADWKTIDGTYWIEQKGAKEENIQQVLFYCYCEGSTKGRLYYMSLGNVIKIDIDADNVTALENVVYLENRAKSLYTSLKDNQEPEIDDKHNPKFWECKYKKGDTYVRCEYYDLCYGDDEDGKSDIKPRKRKSKQNDG